MNIRFTTPDSCGFFLSLYVLLAGFFFNRSQLCTHWPSVVNYIYSNQISENPSGADSKHSSVTIKYNSCLVKLNE